VWKGYGPEDYRGLVGEWMDRNEREGVEGKKDL